MPAATDWQIAAEKFAALVDDKGLFPPYFLAPVVRQDTVASNAKAVEALARVDALIDNPTMQELNRQVEVVDGTHQTATDARIPLSAQLRSPARRRRVLPVRSYW